MVVGNIDHEHYSNPQNTSDPTKAEFNNCVIIPAK